MRLDERRDFKQNSQQLNICDQEFMVWVWSFQDKDEVHEVDEEQQEEQGKQTQKE